MDTKTKRPRVVVEIRGGNIQGAWTDGAELLVYDFDNIKADPEAGMSEPAEGMTRKRLDAVIAELEEAVDEAHGQAPGATMDAGRQ